VGLALDQRTMLEQMVSGQGLSSRVGPASDSMTSAAIFAAEATDSALAGLVDEFIDELAFHIVNAAILVDPARIAVGGGMAGSWDRIAPRLRAALEAAVPYPPELVLAKFPQDAPLLGAVALAVDAAAATAEPANHRVPAVASSANHQADMADDGWAASTASVGSAASTPAQEGPGGAAVPVSTEQISPSVQMDAEPGAANGPVVSNQGIAV